MDVTDSSTLQALVGQPALNDGAAPDADLSDIPPFHILCDDGPLLAVVKPAGLATQAPPQFRSLERDVKDWIRAERQKPGNVYLGVPHRLDRPVSGVVVFARNSKAAARLAEQFQRRRVKKTYWAALEAEPPAPAGRLTDFLRRASHKALSEVCAVTDDGAREAILEYRTLGTSSALEGGRRAWLVEIELITGRMHQIRCQFSARGCPIVGDRQYGARFGPDGRPLSFRMPADASAATPPPDSADTAADAAADSVGHTGAPCERSESAERILLHARQLTLFHPIRYDAVTLVAPAPPNWNRFLPAGAADSP